MSKILIYYKVAIYFEMTIGVEIVDGKYTNNIGK